MTDPAVLERAVADGPLSNYVPENPDATAQVAEILSQLTDLQREVVQMRAGAGLTFPQIGSFIWPDLEHWRRAGRAEQAYYRALRRLKEIPVKPKPDVAVAGVIAERWGLPAEQVQMALTQLAPQVGE